MLVKAVLCVMVWQCAMCAGEGSDELLQAVGGARLRLCGAGGGGGGCAAGGGGCAAAAWRARWAVARASCLARHRVRGDSLRLAPGLSCNHLQPVEDPEALRVISVSTHPYYDLALVAVAGELPSRGGSLRAGNHTALHRHLEDFAIWMEEVYMGHYRSHKKTENAPSNDHYLLSSPLLVFLTTILVPGLMFMGCFLFITFCTGTPVKMPYKNVDDSEIKAPFLKNEYTLEVPTY